MDLSQMTVMKIESDGQKSFVQIHMDDVDFIENDGRRAVLHIGDEKYYLITTKSELDEWLSSRGFDMLDRSNLVNLKKIKAFDEQYGKVYFTENPTKDSKYAVVARVKYEFVKHFIERAIAKNRDHILQYGMDQTRSPLISLKEIFGKR
jgi:DNA-binding LytR/AlgR family response regulator